MLRGLMRTRKSFSAGKVGPYASARSQLFNSSVSRSTGSPTTFENEPALNDLRVRIRGRIMETREKQRNEHAYHFRGSTFRFAFHRKGVAEP